VTHGYGAALALESVFLHRLLVHDALAVPLLPTLGIQLAPPVVGCVAYLGLTAGTPDRVALALLGYGLLQALVLARLVPRIRAQPFAASCWAATFGVTALATAALRMTARGAEDLGWRAAGLFVVANLVVGGCASRSGGRAGRGPVRRVVWGDGRVGGPSRRVGPTRSPRFVG
jgi:tellurite resistance protein